jgi:HAD superfamily hydrolase (TIGR01509 family)
VNVTSPADGPSKDDQVTQGFIFDLDGTLADTMPAHFQAWTRTSQKFGLVFPEDHFYRLGGVPTSKIAVMLIEQAGVVADPHAVALYKEQMFTDLLDIPGAILPIEPVVKVLEQRRTEGPVSIASGGTRELVQRTLKMIGIADWFSVVVAAEDTVRHKPEPDVFLEAARRMGLDPSVCTVYEDTDLGIEAARRANMRWVDVRPLYIRRGAG